MDALDLIRAAALAVAALCVGCRFETRPLGPYGERAPAEMAAEVVERGLDFSNPGEAAHATSNAPSSVAMAGAAAPAPVSNTPDATLPASPPPADPVVEDSAPDPEDASLAADTGASSADASGDDAGDAAPAPVPAPQAGTAFSPCSADSDCHDGLLCTTRIAITTPPPIGYCTGLCTFDGTMITACPQPATGSVKASCQFSALCLLETCERSHCPDGMRCVDTETPTSSGQSFHSFSCAP